MTESVHPYAYSITPAAYLERARALIIEDTARSLFYAALELRCFVEARQDLYLEAQKEYVRSVPRAWKIGAQGKALDGVFRSERIQHISWYVDGELILDTYHIPVSAALRNNAEKLGELLHAQEVHRQFDHNWWSETRQKLIQTYELAWTCNKGSLLSPMFLHDGRTVGKMMLNVETSEKSQPLMKEGTAGIMKVDYPESLPGDWTSDLAAF